MQTDRLQMKSFLCIVETVMRKYIVAHICTLDGVSTFSNLTTHTLYGDQKHYTTEFITHGEMNRNLDASLCDCVVLINDDSRHLCTFFQHIYFAGSNGLFCCAMDMEILQTTKRAQCDIVLIQVNTFSFFLKY